MAQRVPEEYLAYFTSQPAFRTYFFYVSILIIKVLAMAILTAVQRLKNKAFANPEDAVSAKGKVKVSEDVERVRRAHLNDLENIPAFIIVALIYLTTNPSVVLSQNLIRLFTIARLLHTLVYAVIVVPQPARGLSWGVGYAITAYMAVSSLLYYLR